MDSFSQRLHNSPRDRRLFFLALTIISVLAVGYQFGTFDQVFHLPFLKAFANSALYKNDPLVDLRWQNYSFFWFLFLPFYQLDLWFGFHETYILETVLFVCHVLIVYLTFVTIWDLAEELFQNPLTSLIATTAFVIPHAAVGFVTIEFSLLNRTAAMPLLLYCLRIHLQKRTRFALFLVGLLANFHVISALFGAALIFGDMFFNWKKIDLKQAALGALGMFGAAAPVLIWKSSGTPVDFSVNRVWFDAIVASSMQHIYFIWGLPYINFMAWGGLGVLGLFLVVRRVAPAPSHAARLDAFVVTAALVILGEDLLARTYPITILMQLQVLRIGLFVTIIAYINFAHYLALRYKHADAEWKLLSATYLFNIFPFILLVTWAMQKWLPARRWRFALTLLVMLGGTALTVVTLFKYTTIFTPIFSIYPAHDDWYEAQHWARDHTPVEAIFIAPPHIWNFSKSNWRVFSERGTVATLSDTLEVALIPGYLPVWEKRFDAVAPGALAQFNGDYFESQKITERAFYSLTPQQLEQVAHEYGAYYLTVEKPNTRPFHVCYENSSFIIYAITEAAAKAAGCSVK